MLPSTETGVQFSGFRKIGIFCQAKRWPRTPCARDMMPRRRLSTALALMVAAAYAPLSGACSNFLVSRVCVTFIPARPMHLGSVLLFRGGRAGPTEAAATPSGRGLLHALGLIPPRCPDLQREDRGPRWLQLGWLARADLTADQPRLQSVAGACVCTWYPGRHHRQFDAPCLQQVLLKLPGLLHLRGAVPPPLRTLCTPSLSRTHSRPPPSPPPVAP